MINCYIKSKSNGLISKEQVGAWIFTLLSSKYHDEGLNDYFNGSKVKAHSYYIDKEEVEKDSIIKIQIRGIEPLENIIESRLSIGNELIIGNIKFNIYYIERLEPEIKKIYEIKSPIIMRTYKKFYKHEIINKNLNELLIDSIKRKYKLIYGKELKGLINIKILNKIEEEINIKIKGENIVHKGYLGNIEINGTDEAIKFILEVGLGNRTTYGYGIIV